MTEQFLMVLINLISHLWPLLLYYYITSSLLAIKCRAAPCPPDQPDGQTADHTADHTADQTDNYAQAADHTADQTDNYAQPADRTGNYCTC
jgi:hypothetical protein